MGERVVVIGHGAREHALAHKLAYGVAGSSTREREVIVVGGNAGLAKEFECLKPVQGDIPELVELCGRIAPDLVVIGPESYLAEGIKDAMGKIATFGPSKNASALEASKYFTKMICTDAKIATATFQKFTDLQSALRGVDEHYGENVVIKVDGLCAGKGVTVCRDKKIARETLHELFEHDGFARLGTRDHVVIIEEFLEGSEVSVFGLANKEEVVLFCPMQDYKRLYDDDRGPNTGGMGAIGPLGENINLRRAFLDRIREDIFRPVLRIMNKQGRNFSGLLYAGLMLTKNKVFLLEFNVRFGDPETQALLFGTRPDIYPLLKAIALAEPFDEEFWQSELLAMETSIAIVLASAGYPFESCAAAPISLPKRLSPATKSFFASTITNEFGDLMTGNGRVMSIVARGLGVDGARALGYEQVRQIEFAGMQYRKDIGTHVTDLRALR